MEELARDANFGLKTLTVTPFPSELSLLDSVYVHPN